MCKPGLDGHDRGAKVLARALRDAGMEVIYTGIHQTPDDIVNTVIQEDPDAVMLSMLSGSHNAICPVIMNGSIGFLGLLPAIGDRFHSSSNVSRMQPVFHLPNAVE